MNITQILAIKNNYSDILVRRIFLLTFLILFFLCAVVPVWAQNVVIRVYDPQSLFLGANALWQTNFLGPENNLKQPLQEGLEAYYASLFYRLPDPVLIKSSRTETKVSTNYVSNREVFKSFYNKRRVDEKALLRQEWEAAFGFDVWSPYYKYKEIEKLVKNKFSVQVFKFKGEPRVEKGKIFYVFASTF